MDQHFTTALWKGKSEKVFNLYPRSAFSHAQQFLSQFPLRLFIFTQTQGPNDNMFCMYFPFIKPCVRLLGGRRYCEMLVGAGI